MTVQAPPGVARRAGFVDSGDLPRAVAGWSLTRIGAGLWASATGRDTPVDVLALAAEPGRLAIVLDAPGPDQRTDALLAELLPLLRERGEYASVRLVLPAGADHYSGLSYACQLELLVAEADVAVTPHGYTVVRPAGLAPQWRLPQWRRCLPSGEQQPAGVLGPSPAWERHLAAGPAEGAASLAVRRVPAGLALGDEPPDSPSALTATSIWPDAARITLVISETLGREAALSGLASLLPRLPLPATDGVRLYWPRAGSGDTAAALAELAARFRTDLIAPAADVSVSGYGGVCHGPVGAAPWLRFTSDGDVRVLGSLYPEPGWEDALAAADFSGLDVDQVASGLCICRPGRSARGLAATARSIIPAPSGPVVVAGGDAGDSEVRRDVAAALGRLPAGTVRRLRLLLTGAGAGGHDSYAQFVADTFGFVVAAPAGRWTASPDGFVRALPAAGTAASGGSADSWQCFAPRVFVPDGSPPQISSPQISPPEQPQAATPARPAPVSPPAPPEISSPQISPPQVSPPQVSPPEQPQAATPVWPDPVFLLAQPDRPEPPVLAPPSSPAPGPAPVPGPVTLVSRDHRSSARERLNYRESAARYQTYLVAVRRVLTQRPGLRSAASAEGEDAVVTDFAAVLDFLADDQRSTACALRSPGTGLDPRVPCVVSGLRRLPSFTGAVFSSASLPPGMAGGYVPGATLAEPAFVYASSVCRVLLDGNVEYVIWSQTGKRAAALAPDFGSDEIVFAAGTPYKVLKAGPGRVFLRESAEPLAAAGELDEMDHRILQRLETAAALRDQVAAGDRVPARLPGSTGQPIGLDTSGNPFR